MKYKIVVKEGRGYLHVKTEEKLDGSIGYSGILALGNDPKIIADIAKEKNIKIESN